MESKLLDVFSPKRDILFEVAMGAINGLKARLAIRNESFEQVDFDEALFHKVYPNDPNSPAIYFIDDDQYMIFYPPNSTPYAHQYEDKCKFITVVSGVVYDANSDRKFFKGDKVKVYPKDNYAPYTENEKAVIRVCTGDCESLFDQLCA